MSRKKVHVGTPSSSVNGWTRTEISFRGFADLPAERNERTDSPKFSCLGHQWRVVLYPGGEEDSDDGYVALFLSNVSNKAIKIQYGYSIRDEADKVIGHRKPETEEFRCDWM